MNRYELRSPQDLSPSSLFAGARSGVGSQFAAFEPFLSLVAELVEPSIPSLRKRCSVVAAQATKSPALRGF
jgi:hypothetical protein